MSAFTVVWVFGHAYEIGADLTYWALPFSVQEYGGTPLITVLCFYLWRRT